MNSTEPEAEDFDDVDELVMSVRTGLIAKLDAATDFPALLADIYAAADRASDENVTDRRTDA